MNNNASSVVDNPSVIWVKKHNDRVFEIMDLYMLDEYEIGQFIPISTLIKLLDAGVELCREDDY